MGDNIFPKRRNWHSGTNYIFLPSHFCICLEMQRRIAIVAIWNNCDRSVLSVLVVPVHQNRTHKLMHHAFKTWCIVSTSGRFSTKTAVFDKKTAVFFGPMAKFRRCGRSCVVICLRVRYNHAMGRETGRATGGQNDDRSIGRKPHP